MPIVPHIVPAQQLLGDGSLTSWLSLSEGIESRSTIHIDEEPGKTPVDTKDIKYPGPIAFALLLIRVCLAAFIVALGRSIVATAIPQITDYFGSPGEVGWYGSGIFPDHMRVPTTESGVEKIPYVTSSFVATILGAVLVNKTTYFIFHSLQAQ